MTLTLYSCCEVTFFYCPYRPITRYSSSLAFFWVYVQFALWQSKGWVARHCVAVHLLEKMAMTFFFPSVWLVTLSVLCFRVYISLPDKKVSVLKVGHFCVLRALQHHGAAWQDVQCQLLTRFSRLLRMQTAEEQIFYNVCFYENRAQDLRESLSEGRSLPTEKPCSYEKMVKRGPW